MSKRVPIQDTLGVIVAARGVHFSAECISTLIENGAFILHCNEKYRPIGKTIGLGHIIHSEIFERQLRCDAHFNGDVWEILLHGKIRNQAMVLSLVGAKHCLGNIVHSKPVNESHAARLYWQGYFPLFGKKAPPVREHQGAEYNINKMLNYGYAVIGAIVHRSLIAHGLLAAPGVHHEFRFKSEPLVYDLIEPLRPFVDYLLIKHFRLNPGVKMADWAKGLAAELLEYRVNSQAGRSMKLLYAVDQYIGSVADCFCIGYAKGIYIPELSDAAK